LLGSLLPRALDLLDQAVLVLLGALLDLLATRGEVRLQLVGVPAVVRTSDVVIPVLLDEILQVLTVGGSGERDVVVGEPSLELSLMPLVVGWKDASVGVVMPTILKGGRSRLKPYQLC